MKNRGKIEVDVRKRASKKLINKVKEKKYEKTTIHTERKFKNWATATRNFLV